MKKVAGTLKIDQAQYRELEAFTKFSSDMDPVTKATIDKGRKNNVLLVQKQYSPMNVGEQVAILYCGTRGLMKDIDIEKVDRFQEMFLDRMRQLHQADVLDSLQAGKIDAGIEKIINEEAAFVAGELK